MIGGPGRKFLLLRDESPRFLMLPHPQPPAHTLCGFHLPGCVFLQPRFLEPQSLWWSRRWGGEKDQWATGNSECGRVSIQGAESPGLMKEGTSSANTEAGVVRFPSS